MTAQHIGGVVHGVLGWPLFTAATVLLGTALLVGSAAPGRPSRLQLVAMSRIWGTWLWWCQPFWRRSIEGVEHLGDGAHVIISNHRSVIDIPAAFGLPVALRTCARRGIFKVPVMGPFLWLSGQVPSDRLLDDGLLALKEGHSMLIFAEGSRSPDGEVKRFRTGGFRLARQAGLPVVPLAIVGSEEILPKRGFHPRKLVCPVRLKVMPPMSPDPGEDDRAFANRVRAVVAQVVAELDAR